MELLRLEHKKIWHRKSVLIGVLLCFLYVIIFGNLFSYQWFTFGSVDDFTSSFGNRFDGYSNIRKKQEYAKQWLCFAGNGTIIQSPLLQLQKTGGRK